mmetsp:Transcript_21051/g.48725  ORF Transcript_21051/g.48725 Transcript_21051/m.48725 type:complete len:143 (+) Transcript_21051:37-465(+)
MLKQVVLGVAMCVASADAMFHGGGQWQTLEVVPQSAVRVIQPRRGARPGPFRVTPRQQMLACGGVSKECEDLLNSGTFDPSPQDEDYKYSYGYYTNWEDIDEDADIGITGMPDQFGDDLLGSHKVAISGIAPCGGCAEEVEE